MRDKDLPTYGYRYTLECFGEADEDGLKEKYWELIKLDIEEQVK